ncbi:universal stress protein [Arthrobacter flavus]|uniref:Universal stress protein n=1 Tax=Arthrobacter flavus TaxID=95172 RepID=A0ABW4Q508_9MICC
MTDATGAELVEERPIVVAFRDELTGPALLRWAVKRSLQTGQHITMLHAIPDPSLVLPVAAGGAPYGSLIAAARQELDEESRKVCIDYPDAHVTANVHCGDIVDALVSLSEDASLLVVGADRLDGKTGEYLGSVGQQVALGSTSPVAVIPRDRSTSVGSGGADDGGDVVVGVDGSAESHDALRVAAAEASRSGHGLKVVTSATEITADETNATTSVLEQLNEAYPSLTVTRVVDEERAPVESLLFHAADAFLLVIGRHGRGARPGIMLGSVTHTLLLAPPCPTLVVTLRSLPASAPAGGPA